MLFARPTGAKLTDDEEREAAQNENPAVFPLAVPMIAGPGTIATVLLLVNLSHGDRLNLAVVISAYAAALFVTWLCMRASGMLLRSSERRAFTSSAVCSASFWPRLRCSLF
jgi:multiple antibiotic resistance protein